MSEGKRPVGRPAECLASSANTGGEHGGGSSNEEGLQLRARVPALSSQTLGLSAMTAEERSDSLVPGCQGGFMKDGPSVWSPPSPAPSFLLPCLGNENASISFCCYNQSPPTCWLKTIQIRYIPFLGLRTIKWVLHGHDQGIDSNMFPLEAPKQQPFPCLF